MHSLVAVQRRNHTWQGPLADRSQTARAGRHLFPTCATPPAAAAAAAMSCATQRPLLRQLAGRVGKTRREADRSRRGEGGPLCRASVLLQGHGAAPGAVVRSPAAGTPTSAPEDQTDQQHFSFRLRLCGRRAWLARQWMLPRAAPESGTRGRISALPCLASPVSQYACSASLLRLGPQPRSARSAAGRLAGEGRVLAPQ